MELLRFPPRCMYKIGSFQSSNETFLAFLNDSNFETSLRIKENFDMVL